MSASLCFFGLRHGESPPMDVNCMQLDRKCGLTFANLAVMLSLFVLVGCGGKPASVSGVVTLDGNPLERGMVGFAPTSGGMRAAGFILIDGSYTLRTNRESGLDTGEYLVTVVSREPSEEDPQGGPPMPGPYITPKHYAVSSTSGLQFNVEKGSNTIDLELSSEGGKVVSKGRRGSR
jgi:hypothetical protein